MRFGNMRTLALLALGPLAPGCGDGAGPDDQGGHFEISTAPLSLPGIHDVVWTLTVTTNAGAETVWSQTIRSSTTGNGQGAATWVGPCDASAGINRVTLHLDAIEDVNGQDIGDYVNPTPVSLDVQCEENRDVPVEFNIVVAREAQQGFFDVAVNFEDVFCSAKLDCLDDNNQPIDLLFDGATRAPTIVVAFACTSGANEPSWLYMNDLHFTCNDGTDVAQDPGEGPGNLGAGPSVHLFERAVYKTREQLAPYAKCAWANAFGVDLSEIAAASVAASQPIDCSITGSATVAPEAWPLGFSRADTTWPFIQWNVQVINDGALSCSHHGLDSGVGVTTQYTSLGGGMHFDNSMQCVPELPVTKSVACSGEVPYAGGVAVMGMTDASHVQVQIGDAISGPLALPAGATLSGCCAED